MSDEHGTGEHARSLLNRLDAAGPRAVATFRQTRAGEHREYGRLEAIECGPAGIVFQLRVGTEAVRVAATQFADVDFISYRDDLYGEIQCGRRDSPDAVYITWTEPLRQVVAVEFLPKGYVPQ